MSEYNKYDVQPSVQNKGLILLATIGDGCTADALKEHLSAVDKATATHLASFVDLENRGHIAHTQSGLPLIGPSSGDANGVLAKAHNAAIAAIDAKLAEVDAKLAELAAAVSQRAKR
jgi:hypothetical protein